MDHLQSLDSLSPRDMLTTVLRLFPFSSRLPKLFCGVRHQLRLPVKRAEILAFGLEERVDGVMS